MPVTISRNPNLSKTQKPILVENEVAKNFRDIYKKSWWTGLAPENCPGFDEKRQCLNALPLLNLAISTRDDVIDYFNNSWTLTELLFQSIKTESAYVRPPYHGLRHPMIFYYGHTAVIFINKMRIAGLIKDPVDLYLEKVLETGVDEMSWDDMSKNEMAWPKLIDVHQYRQKVYDIVLNAIKTTEKSWAICMGLEHEKIHFETSSVLIRELPVELLERPRYFAPLHPSSKDQEILENKWIKSSGKKVLIGKKTEEPSFGWDNEYGKREVEIDDFYYSEFQITNRDFYEFVASGAYVLDKYWTKEGLLFRKYRNTKRPTFWASVGPEGSHQYELRTLFEYIPMPWNWPCEVNYHEALAYCRWKEEKDQTTLVYRLFTEAEFISLRDKHLVDPILQNRPMKDYKHLIEDIPYHYNFLWSSPEKVNSKIYGNVWHWMMDQFNPLLDFKTNYLYDDFSTPCFDGKHQMILGGSFMSCGNEASHFSRFHFRPHFYQHAGFRMAYTANGSADNHATLLVHSQDYIHQTRGDVLGQMEKENWWKKIIQPLSMSESERKSMHDLALMALFKFEKNRQNERPLGRAHDPFTNGLKNDFTVPLIQTKNFPRNSKSFEELIKEVFEELAPLGQHPGHARFAGYVSGAANDISPLAQMISMSINQYSGHFMMSPGLVAIEEECVQWFLNLMKYDQDHSSGFFTSGSSLASLSAMMMAREAHHKHLSNLENLTAYTSEDAHHSLYKNWVMLGFKREHLRAIKTHQHKMDIGLLNEAIEKDLKDGKRPFLIVSTAGTTKTGSVDALAAIADLAKKYQLWHHVDGAYGAPFMLTNKGRDLLKGIELSDSVSMDLHKAFSLPFGTGLLLVKNKRHMLFDYHGDHSYMPPKDSEHWDYADISPELSRDSRGLRVWLPIKTLGIGPFIVNLEEKLALSEYAYHILMNDPNLHVDTFPELTIQTFSHKKGPEATSRLMSEINKSGAFFLSGAQSKSGPVIRLCLLSHHMHFDHIEAGLKKITQLASEI